MASNSAPSKKKYWTTFSDSYQQEFEFITKSKISESYAFCTICCSDFSILHKGKGDIIKHINRDKHQNAAKTVHMNKKIDFFPKKDELSVIRAECLFSAFLVEHNVPISAADHAGPLFRKMFPNNEIAKKYGCARTKTTAIVNEMACTSKIAVADRMKTSPFSISIDGSNKGDKKLFPIVVTFINTDKVETSLLSVPVLEKDATGQNIADLVLQALKNAEVPYENCLALGVDNARVMVGRNAGVAGFLLKEMPHLFIQGCVCHLLNLAAEKGAAALSINVEEYLIDIYYFLDKSVKRKEKLKKIQLRFDVEVRKILKHVSTRWLSLGRCLERLVEQWEPLTSFFKEEVKNGFAETSSLGDFKIPKIKKNTKASDVSVERKKVAASSSSTSSKFTEKSAQSAKQILSREERIFLFLSSAINKAYVLFLLNTIPIFENANITLQANHPKIHILKGLLFSVFKSLLCCFVRPDMIKSSECVLDVDYHCRENQKEDSELVIGQSATKIVTSISEKKKTLFYENIREYYIKACDYMRHKFPFNDDVVIHAEIANLDKISEMSFSSIKFFIERFPVFVKTLGYDDEDKLLDDLQFEFCNLQVEEIPESVNCENRIDAKWMGLCNIFKDKYDLLSKFMIMVLTLPHSNAECERIFSYVTKTHTQFRSQLSGQTLESLLIVKSSMTGSCFEKNFDNAFLKKAKSAATVANS